MNAARIAYTLVLYALLPRALAHLAWRARKEPAYLEHIAERFGRYDFFAREPVIWVHAVSVGETRAAEPLITVLRASHPSHRILLTHMTPTGRQTGEAFLGDSVLRCYLPYDFPFAVERFLEHFQPSCGILLETEIWPNLIRACHERNMPLYLVNARLSEKSYRGYARFKTLAGQALRELRGVAAQSSEDAARLTALGAAAPIVTGNLKFDSTPDASQLARGAEWREAYGRERLVIVAASTREGEEALLIEAFAKLAPPQVLMTLVPRHPQRFDEVAALLERRGIAFQRRSEERPISAETRIVLGDSMGEMFAYCAAADVAIIGGGFLRFGGQNLLEPCAAGKPVIVGPHMYNFTEATRIAIEQGAALQVTDVDAAVAAACELLRDPVRAQQMGEAGLEFTREHQGAARRIVEMIKF